MEHFNYVKLGKNAIYFQDCLSKKYVQLGFDLNNPSQFQLFLKKDWDSLRGFYRGNGNNSHSAGNFIGQLKRARSADSSFVWLTIEHGHLYWAETKEGAEWEMNKEGATLRVNAWRKTDSMRQALSNDRLPGWLIATSQYKGTVCNAAQEKDDQDDKKRAKTIQRLLEGRNSLARSELRAGEQGLKSAIEKGLKELTPKDFELLIELIFSRSGWRRVSILGKTMKSIDLELELPTTAERAVVQIKSRQDSKATFQSFLNDVVDQWQCEKFFWIQHSGQIPPPPKDNSKVVIWDAKKIAQQVLESGLVSWLGNKI